MPALRPGAMATLAMPRHGQDARGHSGRDVRATSPLVTHFPESVIGGSSREDEARLCRPAVDGLGGAWCGTRGEGSQARATKCPAHRRQCVLLRTASHLPKGLCKCSGLCDKSCAAPWGPFLLVAAAKGPMASE